jgi:uncharacterized membrane protein
MQRLLEIILGLPAGFLSRSGELSLSFNPSWPGQQIVGAGLWNFLLVVASATLVFWAYRRDGRTQMRRLLLGALRGMLLLVVILLLNRPVLVLGNNRIEPSVLAVMFDDSLSMSIRDGAGDSPSPGTTPSTRLQAAVGVFTADQDRLLRELAKTHTLRLYRFDSAARPLTDAGPADTATIDAGATQTSTGIYEAALRGLDASGQSTQIADSLRDVREDLQGQHVAGVVMLTDGRDTPERPLSASLTEAKDWGVKLYPVAMGSQRKPVNVEIESVDSQPSAFVGDYVNIKVSLSGTGLSGSGREVTLHLINNATHQPVLDENGQPVETRISVNDAAPTEAELLFKPTQVGTLDLLVQAEPLADQIDQRNSARPLQINVLDAKIAVLFVDGYPRWDYRYLKNALIRDKSVEVSCLLTGADPDFAQEGSRPITRFPENMAEMMDYDVVLFGDVDPRQFSDNQLQLVNDFVGTKGGGFGMVAGLRWSPWAYKGTPIEPILPVNISATGPEETDTSVALAAGFRLLPTKLGLNSSIFRAFPDAQRNTRYFAEDLPPLFWYCRNVTVKPGVGEVYATHPTDIAPDGHKAPLLVLGRFGAGRTLFSAIDDSWRWRFYTGEHVFETYWLQQLRQLALGRKSGQRRLMFAADRTAVDLGEQVRAHLRILDPALLNQLPDDLNVDVVDAATGHLLGQQNLQRQEGAKDLYNLSYTAQTLGSFILRLPPMPSAESGPAADAGPNAAGVGVPIEVTVPRLEFADPAPDLAGLSRLAAETGGKLLDVNTAGQLPTLVHSVAKVIPVEASQPLDGAPAALVLLAGLLTTEWILRKVWGLV